MSEEENLSIDNDKYCVICNKSFKPSYWKKHIKSKKHLKIEAENEKLYQKVAEITEKAKQEKKNPEEETIIENIVDKEDGEVVPGTEIKDFYGMCKFCDKMFNDQEKLTHHQVHTCTVRSILDDQQSKMENNMEYLKKKVDNLELCVESLQFQLNTVNSFLLNFRELLKKT